MGARAEHSMAPDRQAAALRGAPGGAAAGYWSLAWIRLSACDSRVLSWLERNSSG